MERHAVRFLCPPLAEVGSVSLQLRVGFERLYSYFDPIFFPLMQFMLVYNV